jgi:hypothetical protein
MKLLELASASDVPSSLFLLPAADGSGLMLCSKRFVGAQWQL